MPQPPASDGWRAKLGDTAPAAEGRATLGLLFQLRTLTRDGSQWVAPKGQPATEVLAHRSQRLAVRPVRLTDTGNWVAKDVAWSTVAHRTASLGLDPRQVDWFAQFQGLHRLSGDGYRASEPDWLTLDDFASPLLWPLLRGANDRGIGLVSGRRAERVSLHTAEVTAEVQADGSTGAIRLRPRVRLDEHAAPDGDEDEVDRGADDDHDDTRIVRPTGSIGGHGIYVCDFDDGLRVRLAPVRAADLEVLDWGAGGVRIPSHEVTEFWRDYYPALAHRVPLVGRGLALPDIRDDIVLVVEHLPGDVVETRWERWRGASHIALDDPPIEVPHRLRGADAAAFVSDDLVRIAAQGVRVVHVGDRPDYRERTDVPALEFTAVPGESNDWLDLGFIVTVGAYVVPFADLFSALSRGRTKLLLVDKSWLSLDHPVFDALRDLIAEGEQLAEWETGAVVSRYRATLFEPFEDTSDASPAAVAWRVAAAALSGPPAALDQPDGLRADLRPYQLDGFRRLAHLREHRLGGILADDMGLGKTVQTIALLVHAAGSAPALVVAPTSVVGAWTDELARFAPGLTVTAITDTRMPIPTDGDVIVTSYAVLRLRAEAFAARTFDTVVLDEAQMLKNPAAQVHEAALALRARVKIALTGTPLENSLMDLWSLLRIVSPGLFPSRIRFSDRYAKAHAEVRIAELRQRIRPLLLRRTKREVAAELPPKQEQVVSLELSPSHRDLYERHLQRERQKLLGLVADIDRSRFILFRSLTLLRMLALDPRLIDPEARVDGSSKIDELVDRLESLAAEGRRALVFSQFTSALALVRETLDARGIRYEQLDGSTTRRPEVIERFRSGDAPAFLISLRAGGVGLTLTEADTVFLLDPWWNPAAELQAIDRTHRIGQTQPVMVYRLVAKDTVEEKVVALAEDKQALFDEVFGGGELSTAALSTDELRALLD